MRLTIAYSKIKKRNLVLINNDTYQRETLSERPIRQPLSKAIIGNQSSCSRMQHTGGEGGSDLETLALPMTSQRLTEDWTEYLYHQTITFSDYSQGNGWASGKAQHLFSGPGSKIVESFIPILKLSSYLNKLPESWFLSCSLLCCFHCIGKIVHICTVHLQHHGLREL